MTEVSGGEMSGMDGQGAAPASPRPPESVRTLLRACLQCGRPFKLSRRHALVHRFCSAACRSKSRRALQRETSDRLQGRLFELEGNRPARPRQPVPDLELTGQPLDRRFQDWLHSRHGQNAFIEVRARALQLKAAGFDRYSIAGLFESIRFDRAVDLAPRSEPWKLNNSYRSRLARVVMNECPELHDFFQTRELREVS